MNNSYIEKEIKLKVNDLNKIIGKLKKAKLLGQTFEKTIRFEKNDGSLEKAGIFVRLKSGFSNKITMEKKIKTRSDVFQREEIETKIEDIENMRKILNNLGLIKEFIMEKYRVSWKYMGTEITLDEMPFGYFVEIEGSENKIWRVVEYLELNKLDKITVTYWDIFEDFKKEHNIKTDHIQFQKNYKSELKTLIE
jgi:adenylate cyclase, class 2